MKILIIGGTGFLGSRIVEKLASFHQIMVLHQGKTNFSLPKRVQELLGNRQEIEKYKRDIASFSPDAILDVIPASKKQAQSLLKACQGIAKRIIAISSCDVYKSFEIFLGQSTDAIQPTPLKETALLRDKFYLLKDLDPHLLPSWIGPDYEKIHVEESIMKDSKIQGTVIRLPMIYGSGDVQKRFSEIINWQKNHEDIFLDESTANWMGCWGHVENIVHAICLAITNDKAAGKIYHAADPYALPYSKIVEKIGHASGWKGKIQIMSKEIPETNLKAIFKTPSINAAQNMNLDINKITEELGYRAVISESKAFHDTVKWLTNL